jgi:diguanylate cyclase (GGDEF)-like protein
MRVLVAEDDPVCRRVLEATLGSWGYEPVVTGDGAAAWQLLQAEDPPRMAILDWVMPGLDGNEICRMVRGRPGERYIYLLLLTAKTHKADLLRGLEAGADDYLIKPFDPPELRARLATGRRIVSLQSELIAAREAMSRQAAQDTLTGLANRAAILNALQRELHRAGGGGTPVGVVMADLDHFKRVNDTFGHLAGDAVLRETASRMAAALRPGDRVGRYGGEEFLIVLPGCDEAGTRAVAERLRTALAGDPVVYEHKSIPVTLSLGAVIYRDSHRDDMGALLKAADAALYRAKAAGRNCLVVAPPVSPLVVGPLADPCLVG